jgi:hypothetical protein
VWCKGTRAKSPGVSQRRGIEARLHTVRRNRDQPRRRGKERGKCVGVNAKKRTSDALSAGAGTRKIRVGAAASVGRFSAICWDGPVPYIKYSSHLQEKVPPERATQTLHNNLTGTAWVAHGNTHTKRGKDLSPFEASKRENNSHFMAVTRPRCLCCHVSNS